MAHDYYPAVRKSDSVAGLYDLITEEFITSANSSAPFGAGPVYEEELEY